MIGRGANQTVAIVSTKNGQIVRRLKGTAGRAIAGLAASPDGKTLYFVDSQSIWSIPTSDGEPRRLGPGDGVAPSPDGQYLVVQYNEAEGIRLAKLRVTGGEPEPIMLNLGDLRLWGRLTPNAVGDGRIVAARFPMRSALWRFRPEE
ncbi:MAG: PD40 domain-containing protein [Acidobacteria bacterium]|nr:PD40 domain-containing protein [Acidobacteriota bacterium]